MLKRQSFDWIPAIILCMVSIWVTLWTSDLRGESEVAGDGVASLSAEQRVFGLAKVWSEIKYNYPMWHRLDDLDWDAEFHKRIPAVTADQSDWEYYRKLQNFASLIRDGHVGVYPPTELSKECFISPPILLWKIGNSYSVVAYPDTPDVRNRIDLGDEVITVDGIRSREYAERYISPFIGDSSPQSFELHIANILLRGRKGSHVLVKFRKPDGTEYEYRFLRSTVNKVSWVSYLPLSSEGLIRGRKIAPGVGYIKIGSFGKSQVVEQFFEALQALGDIETLIIDLRVNSGGNSNNGDQIISHLIQEPVKGMMEKRAYYSPTLRGWGQGEQGNGITWKNFYTPQTINPSSDAPNFQGNLMLLTSSATASASEDFVGPLKSSGRAIIIGEETGGSTGNPLYFDLPGGGKLRVCSRYMLLPDGTEFIGTGIIPDIVVAPTLSDVAAEQDPILERAVAEINRGANSSM